MQVSRRWHIAISSLAVLAMVMFTGSKTFAREKYETIDATAMGTGTQMGANIGVTLNIYQFSTPADKQILVDAFNKGQDQGLSNALQRMKAVGHVEITGTLGNDCSYISMTHTPTGRRIIFITSRQIRFVEAYTDSYSQNFNLTAGVLELNDQDKSKSTGVLYPMAELTINKGQLQWDLNRNPWQLVDLIDWAGTAGVN